MKNYFGIKFLILTLAIFSVFGLSTPAFAITDDDGDSVANSVEQAAPLGGDSNSDGVQDEEQSAVASIPNPNDTSAPGSYVTLQVGDPNSEDWRDQMWGIDEFKSVASETLPTQPDGKVFPLGLFNIKLGCRGIEGSSCVTQSCPGEAEQCDPEEEVLSPIPANLTLIFDRVMDTSNWTATKYNTVTNQYADYSDMVTIDPANTDFGYARTVLRWTLLDGQFGDDDGVLNDSISDPIGPTILGAPRVLAVPAAANVKPKFSTTAAGPVLADTGIDSQYVMIIGAILFVAGLALIPKKSEV